MLKKMWIFLVFCICLSLHTYADGERNIRVGLYYGDNAKEQVQLNIDGEMKTITVNDVLTEVEFYPQQSLEIEGVQYRGYVTVKNNGNGGLTVINTVDLEDYLCSVVSKEMSPSFEMEALKAQAVAARTYVLKKLLKHESSGFDVCSSVHCQAYGGIESEHEKTTNAVFETKGQVITYEGQLIEAVYSATSGGYTEAAVNVWGNDIPYLQAVSDQYEEEDVFGHAWERTLTADKATEIMGKYEIGYVKDIRIDEVSPNGAVTKLTVVGTKGEKTFNRESCRNIFSSVTLSQAYTITPVSQDKGFMSLAGKIDKSNMYLLSYDNIIKFTNQPVYFLTEHGVVKREPADYTSYIFTGRGYGHLVGLSQNGANGMAKNGFTYDQILKHYYKGTEIN